MKLSNAARILAVALAAYVVCDFLLTAECETRQIWPISRRRSPKRPAKVKPAATAEITTRGKRVRL